MAFFKKLKDRLFKSSSKLDEGLEAIVEDGGVEEQVEAPAIDDTAELRAQDARDAEDARRAEEAREAEEAARRAEEAANEARALAAAQAAEAEQRARAAAEAPEAETSALIRAALKQLAPSAEG